MKKEIRERIEVTENVIQQHIQSIEMDLGLHVSDIKIGRRGVGEKPRVYIILVSYPEEESK